MCSNCNRWLCLRIFAKSHHCSSIANPLSKSAVTCGCEVFRQSTKLHSLVPSIDILSFLLKPHFDAVCHLFSDPLLPLKVSIIDYSQCLCVPSLHRVRDKLVRSDQPMRGRRKIQSNTSRMNGTIIPAILMHIR